MTDFLDGRVTLLAGDCREVIRSLADASIDSVVCDPPYALVSIVKRFGKAGSAEAKGGVYQRSAAGFMGKTWDNGEAAFAAEFWAEVLRVLKPGGHVLAFSGTRTYHRLACAIEDAGFEIRDQIGWAYGSGFPKSHDVSKGIDKRGPEGQAPFAEFAAHYEACRKTKSMTHAAVCAAGGWHGKVNHGGSSVNWANGYGMPTTEQWAVLQPLLGLDDKWGVRVARVQYEREVLGIKYKTKLVIAPGQDNDRGATSLFVTAPSSKAARRWEGWGTALKPAWEPIVMARKPLVGTVAANVLEHGTGALNIDGCRVGLSDGDDPRLGGKGDWSSAKMAQNVYEGGYAGDRVGSSALGRWPANIIHDGSPEVLAAFPDSDGQLFGTRPDHKPKTGPVAYGDYGPRPHSEPRGDSGSAARFFYSAKADAEDRLGSKHPTVKPLDLMQYLVRLVTPPGGLVLDPFAGTGTTGEAAFREGMRAVLIEREPEYQADIARRMELAENPTKRAAVAKSKNNLQGAEGTPLFGDEAA